MSKQKLNLDPQKIIAWMRGNIVLVVLLIACIGAAVGLPMFASSWSAEVQQALKKKAGSFSTIDKLTKSQVKPIGGGPAKTVVINQELVDQYRTVINLLRDDAQQVLGQAKQHNQKDYTTMYPELFEDNVVRSQLETLPQKFYVQLQLQYKALLFELNAGRPPAVESLVTSLEESRVRFMENKLSKPRDASLTEKQYAQLELYLTDRRMSILRNRAKELGLYLDEETLEVPEFDNQNRPNVGTLFTWQWRYWAVADVLGAIATANGSQSELTSPVKHVTLVQVSGLPEIEQGKKNTKTRQPDVNIQKNNPPPRRGGGVLGVGGVGKGGDVIEPTKSDKPAIKNQRTRPRFGDEEGLIESYTDRANSSLYDTLQVRLRMVVSTARIPTILDIFAQHNFVTVIDIDLQPVNKFDSLEEGFDYGAEPVSELTVVLETVWLRAWTVELMPASVKAAMGI